MSRINIWINKNIESKLKYFHESTGKSKSGLINELLENYFDRSGRDIHKNKNDKKVVPSMKYVGDRYPEQTIVPMEY